jgi:hypothetical protein
VRDPRRVHLRHPPRLPRVVKDAFCAIAGITHFLGCFPTDQAAGDDLDCGLAHHARLRERLLHRRLLPDDLCGAG